MAAPGRAEPPAEERSVATDALDYRDALSLGVVVADSPGIGVLVVEVAEQSPADAAGIRADDFIMSVDGKEVEQPSQLQRALRSRRAGDQVSLGLWRGGKTLSVTADLAVAAEQAQQQRPWLGVALGRSRPFARKPGPAVIVQVLPDSPAEKADLQVGDTVVSLDDQAIDSSDQLVAKIGAMKVGETIHLTVNRDGNEVAHEIKLESSAAAPAIATPFGFGPVPPVRMLDEELMPMVPFGHVMRGEDFEDMQQQMNEIRKQMREMQKRLRMRVGSAIDDDDAHDDDDDADDDDADDDDDSDDDADDDSDDDARRRGDVSKSPTRAVRPAKPDRLPQIAVTPVLAAPDERSPNEAQDREARAQYDRQQRAQAYAARRAPNHRYHYYYYRWPSSGASVYPGFYVPWYTFPTNSPHIYNWPPRRLPYYYQYRGRSFYVRPPYGYGAGFSGQVYPSVNGYYQ